MIMTKPNIEQFVHVEFARAICNMRPRESKHPWHWFVIVQRGHIYACSNGHATLNEAIIDFSEHGVKLVEDAEKHMAALYADTKEQPYDVCTKNKA